MDRPTCCCVGVHPRCARAAAAALRATPHSQHPPPSRVECRAAQQAAPSESAAAALASFSPESSVDEAASSASSRAALSALGIPPVTDPQRQLFDAAHVAQWTPALVAYAPIGALLALLRMAAWVGGIALDAPWFRHPAVVDAYMALLGVSVEWQDERNIPKQVRWCLAVFRQHPGNAPGSLWTVDAQPRRSFTSTNSWHMLLARSLNQAAPVCLSVSFCCTSATCW